jgi:hypothetical protein
MQSERDQTSPGDIVSDTGTVQYVDLEGGFYGIVADDSTRYLPDSLGARFREDGLRVRFRGERRDDVMTAPMWGQPVRLIDIARLRVD